MHNIIRVITGAIIPGCIVGGLMFLLFQAGAVTDQIEQRSFEPVSGIEFNAHRVVLSSTLPSCQTEDDLSGQPCTWNVTEGDGNGIGLAYYSKGDGILRFVWPSDPTVGPKWRWVPGHVRVMLRDSGVNLDISCMWRTDGDDYSIVRCANGEKYMVNY